MTGRPSSSPTTSTAPATDVDRAVDVDPGLNALDDVPYLVDYLPDGEPPLSLSPTHASSRHVRLLLYFISDSLCRFLVNTPKFIAML
jgi:hypothetical protein